MAERLPGRRLRLPGGVEADEVADDGRLRRAQQVDAERVLAVAEHDVGGDHVLARPAADVPIGSVEQDPLVTLGRRPRPSVVVPT